MNDNDVIIDADFAYKVIKHITSRSHIAMGIRTMEWHIQELSDAQFEAYIQYIAMTLSERLHNQ